MGRIAYVNGRYLPHGQAKVHVEDRGYQFADGVYEVIAIRNGRLVDEDLHLDRLDRSLTAVKLAWPVSRAVMAVIAREMVARNRIHRFGLLYLQVTRGVAPRNHAFPQAVRPALVMTARQLSDPDPARARLGVGVITVADIRWKRCDIKSIALLPNTLGKQAAVEAGAYEAWLVDERGFVTEGTASNAWIVADSGQLVTRHADAAILNGITRQVVLADALARGHALVERPFSVAEAKRSREAFLTSTTSLVKPVVAIDGEPIGDGRPGPLTLALIDRYLEHLGA